jgi:hypothetical protein
MKSNTKNTKHGGRRPLKTIYPFHEEWRKTYPSFIERGTSEQLASNKLDSRSSLGYHRINGKVQQRSRFVGPTHITNARNVHIVHSSKRAARKYPGLPVDSNVIMVMERPGDRDQQPQASSPKLREIQAASLKPQA